MSRPGFTTQSSTRLNDNAMAEEAIEHIPHKTSTGQQLTWLILLYAIHTLKGLSKYKHGM